MKEMIKTVRTRLKGLKQQNRYDEGHNGFVVLTSQEIVFTVIARYESEFR
jgi:hypothetical protein